jgi:hypothetical protein
VHATFIKSPVYTCKPLPLAVRSKTYVRGLLIAGLAGSNLFEGMDILSCVRFVLCRYRPLRGADHSSRGLLPGVFVCARLILCDIETSRVRRPRPDLGCCATENIYIYMHFQVCSLMHSNRQKIRR